MTIYPNLIKLNVLLRSTKLGLPEFRTHVDPSGRNLKWLKKVVSGHPECNEELKKYLDMTQSELLRSIPDETVV